MDLDFMDVRPGEVKPMEVQEIRLTGLRVQGTHGVLESEHTEPQDFVVDIAMDVCVDAALQSDSINDTISYAEVADLVVEIVQGDHVDLIESLADRIANEVAKLGARAVTVTVHKPSAPIPHTFADVSVTAERVGALFKPERRRVVLGIGSNLDVPEAHVVEAVSELAEMMEIEAVSELYRTAPRLAEGQEIQPDYVNAVVTGYISAPPLVFLHYLQHIEADHGRVRTKHWESRTLDIDVVDIEGLTSKDPELIVPHPRAKERRFVLEPWLSIDPAAELAGESVAKLAAELGDQDVAVMDPDEYMPRVIATLQEAARAAEELDDESGFDGPLGPWMGHFGDDSQ